MFKETYRLFLKNANILEMKPGLEGIKNVNQNRDRDGDHKKFLTGI